MIVEVVGNGFDRNRGRLYPLESFEEPLPSNCLHGSEPHRQVKETIELARADSEQTGQSLKSDPLICSFSELPAGLSNSPAQRLGRHGGSGAHLLSVNYLMNSVLEFGQWASTAVETGPTAVHNDLLPRMPVKVVIHLEWAHDYGKICVRIVEDLNAVLGVEAEDEQGPALEPPQAVRFQPTGSRDGRPFSLP